jgi:hypothetical protein
MTNAAAPYEKIWRSSKISCRTATVATCREVTGQNKITQQLNISLIISNNKLDHNQPNGRIMLVMMTILNATDMLGGILTNQKHG